MTRAEYIADIKTRFGEQMSKDGMPIRDMDDDLLLEKMLTRYPGDRDEIDDLDETMTNDLPEYPKTELQRELETKKQSFLSKIKENFDKRVDTASDEILEDQNPIRKGLRVLGQGAGFAGDIANETISAITPDAVGERFQEVGESIAESPVMQKVGEKHEEFKEAYPEFSKDIEDVLGFASIIPGVKTLTKGITKGIEKTPEVVDVVKGKADDFKASRVAKAEMEVDDAVGRIVQGKPEDIDKAKKALSNIDTEGVETYADLNSRIDERVGSLSNKLDAILDENPVPLTSQELANRISVNGQTIMVNPVEDALDELLNYYTKINDKVSATKMTQLVNKLGTEGLTLKEVNNLAKLHGRDLNAFNANGELASGLSKQAAENTRKGLKTVVRDRLDGDVAKELDKQMSDLLQTSDLTKKMEENVNKLYQKIKNRTLAQKVGGAAADVIDLVSLGTLRGFIQKLLPSNVGLKTANSLDLEKELKKNLEKIQKMVDMEDGAKFDSEVSKLLKDSNK